jgi:hypothetical protein
MKRIEHLKVASEHLWGRIGALDNKASILVALQTGLFVVVAFLADDVLLDSDDLVMAANVVVCVHGLLSVVVVALLLQVIRPAKRYLCSGTGMEPLDAAGIMWPKPGKDPSPHDFQDAIANLQGADYEKDLRATVFAGQCMVYRKYNAYRPALVFAKLDLLLTSVLLASAPIWGPLLG